MDKEWKKLEKLLAWQMTRVRSKKEVIQEAQKEQRTVHAAALMEMCHLKHAELVRTEISEIQRLGCNPRLHSEGRFWLLCRIHTARFVSITNDGRKSDGCHSKAAECAGQAADAVSSCTQVNMKERSRIIETSKLRMSRYLDTSTVLLERNLYRHPLARFLWERQFENVLLGARQRRRDKHRRRARRATKRSMWREI